MSHESSSKVFPGSDPSNSNNNGRGGSNQTSSHLLISGHKLTGKNYLQWSKSILISISGNNGDRDTKGYIASENEGVGTVVHIQEQVDQLQKMVSDLNASVVGAGSVATKGTFSTALNVKKEVPGTWIVDSGATDHMTGDARVFSTFEPCQGNYNVKIADGSLSKVTGCGTVIISNTLTLQSVLYVPNLDCNLLSISKLTYDEKCV